MKIKDYICSAVIALIVYGLLLVTSIAMLLPKNVGETYVQNGEATSVYGIEDILTATNCTVQEDGKYNIIGLDPQLVFKCDGSVVDSIKINLVSQSEASVGIEVFTAFEDEKFSSDRYYVGAVFNGEWGVIDLPRGEYSFLRVDINLNDVTFINVSTFDTDPDTEPIICEYSAKDYAFTAVVPLAVAIATFFLNRKFRFVQKVCAYIAQHKNRILLDILICTFALILSVIIELAVDFFGGAEFNIYRWVYIMGIAELIAVFICGYKCLSDKPENLFLPVVLILGVMMLFSSPIKHICWDLDSHYAWAVQNSYPGTTYATGAYDDIVFHKKDIAVSNDGNYASDIEELNEREKIVTSKVRSEISVAHLPSGAFIALGRLFGANFAVKYNLGRLANLLIYSVVCYFAVRKIKSGKMIIATICLLPTNIFMATNYTYDWWCNAFTVLGTSYFVSELQEREKAMSVKDTVIMAVSFALGAIPKLVYVVLMGMTLFMHKNWRSKQERRKYYVIIILVLLATFAMFVMRSMSTVGGTGDTRGGATNPKQQILGILRNHLQYAELLISFLRQYLSIGGMKGYISNYAYLGFGTMWYIPVALICITALTDATDKISFKIPVYIRILSIVLFVGMSAVVATALYISYTPVGLNAINGCQPRYILPLLAPLLLLVTGKRVNIFKNKYIYNGVVMALMIFTVAFETFNVITVNMI